jgi:AraC-like DNA-binding protein/ActR/RegA family two-component response regulator
MNVNHAPRFDLVSAAHQFLVHAIPLQQNATTAALTTFLQAVASSPLSVADVDAILLRCLTILDRYTGGRLPSLVDRYLNERVLDTHDRFRLVVTDVVKHRGVAHPTVRRAIAIMDAEYSDAALRQQQVAREVGVSASQLSAAFKRDTGRTYQEYLRDLRLDRAADLLMADAVRIKDVWVSTGYNHASNFAHDFKRRFGSTPTAYRSRVIGGVARNVSPAPPPSRPQNCFAGRRVLVVDDDETTRETLRVHLSRQGFDVNLAASAEACLATMGPRLPHAILLDYNLPGMDGMDCLRQLRRQHSPSMGIAIFTADWDVERHRDEIRSLRAAVASKLCDLEDVSALVRALCGAESNSPVSIL